MDDVGSSCTLLVTRLGEKGTNFITRKEAYDWACTMVQESIAKEGALMEGHMDAVIPCRQTVTGFLFKLVFRDVPDRLMRGVIIPGIKEKGCTVSIQDINEAAQQRKQSAERLANIRKRVNALGNTEDIVDVVKELMRMRGDGGPEEKRRKFVQGAMDVIRITTQVAGSTLAKKTLRGGVRGAIRF